MQGIYYIENIIRDRRDPGGVEQLIKHTASLDGKQIAIYIEQEPGSAGKHTISHYSRHVLKGYTFEGDRATGSKVIRANPLSAAAKNGNVKLVKGSWNEDFLDEAQLFPEGNYKDQIDACSGAFSKVDEAFVVQNNPDAMEILRGVRLYA